MNSASAHPSPFERLRHWMSFESHDIWVVVVYSVAVGLLSLVVPIATQSLVNTIAFGTLLQPLVVLVLLVLLALLFSTLLKVMRAHVVEVLQRRVFVRVSSDSMERLLKVRVDAFDEGHGPELVNRFFDVVTLQKGGATLLIEGLEVLMSTLVGMSLLAVYHPLLLAFALILLFFVFIVLFPLGTGAVKTSVKESKAKYELAAWLQELARHPATFKSAPGTAYALERGNSLMRHYLDYRQDHWRILLRQIIGSHIMQAVGTAAVLGAGGWLVIERQLTLGQLVAAELVVASTLAGFSKFGKQLENFYDLLAAVDKLGYLTDLPLEKSGREQISSAGAASIELRGVEFAYKGRPNVLAGMNLKIPAGSRIGVLGESGSGKSSLVDLLYGFREPTAGTLLFDRLDYRNLRLYDLRGQVALVRGIEIFQGTIEDNIRFGDESVTSSEIRAILHQVGLLETVDELPNGLATELTTGGQPLTIAQALRLMLARAIALRPRVLILDEVLDLMEETPERDALLQRLTHQDNPWTLIMTSRSMRVLAFSDRTICLENGSLREEPKS
jgi:putative ABC transport system ATP-binding protein